MAEAFDVEARRDAWEELRPVAAGGSGMAATITRKRGGTPSRNLATGVVAVAAAPTVNGCGMLVRWRGRQVDGERVRATDLRLWLAALDVDGEAFGDVEVGDKVALGGKTYEVMGVEPYRPAGLTIYSYLQLR